MKLPWTKLKEERKELEEEVEELEQEISRLKEERESFRQRFEAEEERRKKLSRRKQEAEEKINRLEDRIKSFEKEEDNSDATDDRPYFKSGELEFEEAVALAKKLESIKSDKKDLITVYSPDKASELADLKSLKNSVTKEQFSWIKDISGFAAFVSKELGGYILKLPAFFPEKVLVSRKFDLSPVLDFVEQDKYWVLASAGYTEIFREQNGDYEEVEVIKSRVDRDHSKGGFSQGRFERKRDEQIENHTDRVKEKLEDLNTEMEIYVLGSERIGENLPGTYLGGFDPNRKKPEQFYRFKLERF